MTAGKEPGTPFPAVDPKQMAEPIGVDHGVQEVGSVLQLVEHPVLHILLGHHMVASLAPGLGEVQEIAAADAGLVVSADGAPVGLDYEMVPLPAHRMPAPPFEKSRIEDQDRERIENQHLATSDNP